MSNDNFFKKASEVLRQQQEGGPGSGPHGSRQSWDRSSKDTPQHDIKKLDKKISGLKQQIVDLNPIPDLQSKIADAKKQQVDAQAQIDASNARMADLKAKMAASKARMKK